MSMFVVQCVVVTWAGSRPMALIAVSTPAARATVEAICVCNGDGGGKECKTM